MFQIVYNNTENRIVDLIKDLQDSKKLLNHLKVYLSLFWFMAFVIGLRT